MGLTLEAAMMEVAAKNENTWHLSCEGAEWAARAATSIRTMMRQIAVALGQTTARAQTTTREDD
eukprot:9500053-Pyramimonas_sp.AAC.1